MSTLVKICVNTSASDALLAERVGADYVGVLIDHPASPRSVNLDQALVIREAVGIPVVVVTVNQTAARLLEIWEKLRPAALQLHGDETLELVAELKAAGATVWPVVSGDGDSPQTGLIKNPAGEPPTGRHPETGLIKNPAGGPSAERPLDATRLQVRAEAMVRAGADALLVDARVERDGQMVFGGTGHQADWAAARQLVEQGHRVILAGGLTPANVAAAIRAVRPWMVDVASGVEASKGVKDAEKVRSFVAAARQLTIDN